MILIIAGRLDDSARDLAAAFPKGTARVLTCRDLSRPGWRLRPAAPTNDRIVVGGRLLSASRVAGIVTLLPCIFPAELTHIVAPDRDYVASEMTAFLVYWLSGLNCPMLNRATPGCLSGPSWRVEFWCRLAQSLKISVQPPRRTTHRPHKASAAVRSVTVVGSRVVGSDSELLATSARAIAAAASVDLLQTFFSTGSERPRFIGATPIADVSSPAVRGAIVDHFKRSKS
ncbi:MAG: hypothetical protein HY695_34420 [Deltaproteobacteria bacterium]|nr:hypothetical protein [Deltaproteobacteria bacterium]